MKSNEHSYCTPMLAYLEQIQPLSIEIQSEIAAITRPIDFARNTVAHSPGGIATHFHFILRGIGRVYYFSDGNEITDYFAAEHQFIGALDSLFSGKPSLFGVQFLEDTEALTIRYADLERLYQKHHALERVGRIIATQSYLEELSRTKEFQTISAKQRYKALLETETHLLHRVSLGHIASYLGISQVQLSRIRSSL